MALQNWVGLNDVVEVEAGSSAGCLLAKGKYPQVCEFSSLIKIDYEKHV